MHLRIISKHLFQKYILHWHFGEHTICQILENQPETLLVPGTHIGEHRLPIIVQHLVDLVAQTFVAVEQIIEIELNQFGAQRDRIIDELPIGFAFALERFRFQCVIDACVDC